jgi:hypothetical protein
MPQSFDHAAALADLHALGRQLDRQVTHQTDPSATALDATLRLMKQVHTEIELSLGASTSAIARRSYRARTANA